MKEITIQLTDEQYNELQEIVEASYKQSPRKVFSSVEAFIVYLIGQEFHRRRLYEQVREMSLAKEWMNP
jgi:hypothetical protein